MVIPKTDKAERNLLLRRALTDMENDSDINVPTFNLTKVNQYLKYKTIPHDYSTKNNIARTRLLIKSIYLIVKPAKSITLHL